MLPAEPPSLLHGISRRPGGPGAYPQHRIDPAVLELYMVGPATVRDTGPETTQVSQKPPLRQRDHLIGAHDKVVEDADIDQRQGVFQPPRHLHISLARLCAP